MENTFWVYEMKNADIYLEILKKDRRYLHMHPELGHCEYNTSEYIKNRLLNLGYSPFILYNTGVGCFIDMGAAESIGLRADIDALPIFERSGAKYSSLNDGVMHACGHDGHTSILLALAEYIKRENAYFAKNILLIFQPAEETDGGAEKIISEGVLERFNVINVFGVHVSADFEVGEFASTDGEFFAGGCELYFEVEGISAHAAKPNEGVNSLYAASLLVNKVSKIVLENEQYSNNAVLSLCTMNCGTKCNIIPNSAKISGIMRAFSPDVLDALIKDISLICGEIENETSTKVNFKPVRTYIPLINDKGLFDYVNEVIQNNLKRANRTFLTDDFAFFAKAVPSLYIFVGVKDAGHSSSIHSDDFDFDEKALLCALDLYIKILFSYKKTVN